MIKLTIYMLALMALLSVDAVAQGRKGAKTSAFLQITEAGVIVDTMGVKLGYIDKDNIVRNSTGEVLYFIDKLGNAIDYLGKTLGKVDRNGNYITEGGDYKVLVIFNGEGRYEIHSESGQVLGLINEAFKLHAGAAYCYFIKDKKYDKSRKRG